MDRRKFLQVSSLATGGLLISVNLSCNSPKEQSPGVFKHFNSYLRIDTNGIVEILNPVPEIGQGVLNSLPMLVAEELNIPWESVQIKQAPAGTDYGGSDQRAAGSNSVRRYWEPMRLAGASARELLKKAAAQLWNIEIDDCYTEEGFVHNTIDRKSKAYGELVELASTFEIPENIQLKDRRSFNFIGSSPQNKSTKALTSGEAKFGLDTRVDGMVYASSEKCKTYGAAVKSFNKEEVLAINGVSHCFIVPFHGSSSERPYCREGVAVVGDSAWSVLKGRRALKIEWDLGVNANENSNALHEQGRSLLERTGKYTAKSDGDTLSHMQKEAHETYEADYHLPFIVHIPMETLNCTVDLKEDSCELWSTTQMPFAELNFVSNFLELPVENIKINVPRIGGGFGRRLGVDWTIEALKIAKEVKKPVHFFWTREDDIQLDGNRPFSYHKLKAGIDETGKVKSWLHRQAGTSRYAFRSGRDPHESEFFPNHFPANLIDNFRQEYHLIETNINATLLRAPGNNALAFPVESFIDELAIQLKQDPLSFRLELLGEDREFLFDEEDNSVISTGRMKNVLMVAARGAGWGKKLPDEHGLGIAGYFTFDSYVAHVAHVSVDPVSKALKIHKFYSAVDCGQVLNPDGVKAQVEGAIMDGLSATLFQEITVSDGGNDQTNFHNYHVLRMPDAPDEIEVFIVKNDYPPTGIGEPPYPPVAPALCNAIYDSCGVRIRKLPIKDQIKTALQNASIQFEHK